MKRNLSNLFLGTVILFGMGSFYAHAPINRYATCKGENLVKPARIAGTVNAAPRMA